MPSYLMEDGVKTNEFYYLLLVLSAFGTFAVSMSLATVRYRASLRRVEGHRRDASEVLARSAARAA